jgi:hypothetical protein
MYAYNVTQRDGCRQIFKQAHDSITGEVLYNIHFQFGVGKAANNSFIKMTLSETNS